MKPASLVLLALSCAAGCVDYPPAIDAPCPSFVQFRGTKDDPATEDIETLSGVSELLEKRCATLDCHGHIARPLRIYSKNGLRRFNEQEFADNSLVIENGTFPGAEGKETTDEERLLNYRSVCAVEPELMGLVVTGQSEPSELIVLDKPTGHPDPDDDQKHKGGRLFNQGDPAWKCINGWLGDVATPGLFVAADCDGALDDN